MSATRPPAPDEPHISVALTDASGRVLFARDPERIYYAASTMKLAVLLAATRQVADGALSLEQEIPTSRTFTSTEGTPFVLGGDHLDPELPPPGTPMPLADHLDAMITRSSNEATNSVMELMGIPAVAQVARACGIRVERLIGDPTAVATGLTNEVTAIGLTTLMQAVTTGRVPGWPEPLPRELVELHIGCLERQTIAPIGAALPTGVRWGSKSGEIDGIRHDVAFVGDPGTDDVRHLAVCTQGLDEAAADESIAALTQALLHGSRHGG